MFYLIEITNNNLGLDVIDFEKFTIEHIIPQKPEEWGYNPQDIKPFVHTIGNLGLLEEGLNQPRNNKTISNSTTFWDRSSIIDTKNHGISKILHQK